MSDRVDPMEERRLRLEQAEREARGDFTQQKAAAASLAKASSSTDSKPSASAEAWSQYKRKDDGFDDSPAAQLNKQHNNFRAQAKVDQGIMGLLDFSLPRQER